MRGSVAAHAGPSDVFVLDFDGVLVDSEPEITASAFEAAQMRWPQLLGGVTEQEKQDLFTAMRVVRPVLVRGYESMVMLRMLRVDPQACDLILGSWSSLLEEQIKAWQEDADELNTLFEATRNDWMNNRSASWMSLQPAYDGIVDALRTCPFPSYIASSKAAHRVSALSQAALGLDISEDSPRLFASLLPPEEKKCEALRTITSRPVVQDSGARLHFVDDRLDTLTAVQRAGDLQHVKLYLADWGYNTATERAAAARTPGIKVLTLAEFLELLKWGVVMGVDDGCEPTPEEVAGQFE